MGAVTSMGAVLRATLSAAQDATFVGVLACSLGELTLLNVESACGVFVERGELFPVVGFGHGGTIAKSPSASIL